MFIRSCHSPALHCLPRDCRINDKYLRLMHSTLEAQPPPAYAPSSPCTPSPFRRPSPPGLGPSCPLYITSISFFTSLLPARLSNPRLLPPRKPPQVRQLGQCLCSGTRYLFFHCVTCPSKEETSTFIHHRVPGVQQH